MKTHVHIEFSGDPDPDDIDKLLALLTVGCEMLGVEFEASLLARCPDVVARRDGIEATVRRAIRDDRRTIHAISKDTGVPPTSLDRFVKGASMTTGSMQKLCLDFGLFLGRPVLREGSKPVTEEAERELVSGSVEVDDGDE